MFNNFINSDDFLVIFNKIKRSEFKDLYLRFNNLVTHTLPWEHIQSPPTQWYDMPQVKIRWNKLITGNEYIDHYEYVTTKYLSGKNSLRALSLGCGSGDKEIKWCKTNKFSLIDAYDTSKNRISFAQKKALELGINDIMNFQNESVHNIKVVENYYDFILVDHSLHHFSPLEKLLHNINIMLKPDGLFIVNDYVGPTRFQWTDRQLEAANGLLSILPYNYKIDFTTNKPKLPIFRPSKLSMIVADISEAVESSKILPLLEQIFNIVEIKEYGGSILSLLFKDIGHNFLNNNHDANIDSVEHLLKICFDVEELLLEQREITSDYDFIVCKKQQKQ